MVRIFGIGKARAEREARQRREVELLEARVVELKGLRDDAVLTGRHEQAALLTKQLDEVNERLVMTLDLRGFDLL